MNREIKFRVWDKGHETYLPLDVYDIHSKTSFGSFGIMRKSWKNYSEGEYFYEDAQVLEQFTGLTDKNGKDIYEGDIVNHLNEGNAVVTIGHAKDMTINCEEYDVDFCGVYLDIPKTNTEDRTSYGEWEVIGNIHENPELIEQ